ncbi:MAG: glutamate racemase [Candidatus Saccharimonadales bacterium]
MTIGVFDSGVGGLSVAEAIQKAYPNFVVEFLSDSANMPYGDKTPDELLALAAPILQNLAARADVIVIACNTLSTTLLPEIKKLIQKPIIALVPMVKPAAAMTKSQIIAVCATPTTLASRRYNELKQAYAKDIKVLQPDCSDWAQMIEHKIIDQRAIAARIDQVLAAGADVIVLGCTHYHWIEAEIKYLAAGRAQVLQPEPAIVRELGRVLADL